MFSTEFSFNSDFNQYELKIDGSKHDVTITWLQKYGVRFNVTAFSRYVLIELVKVSDTVIDTLNVKFPTINPAWTRFCLDVEAELRSILSTGNVEDLEAVALQVAYLEDILNNLTREQEEAVETYEAFLEFVIKQLTEYAIDQFDAWGFVEQVRKVINVCSYQAKSRCDFQDFLNSLRPVTRFSSFSTIAEVKAEYRCLAKTMHPDTGGNAEDFALLNSQYNDALNALRGLVIA